MPGVIGPLHPDPDQRLVPEQLGQPHGDRGADGFAGGQDVVQVLARDAEHAGDFGLGFAGGGDHILAQHFARMGRAAVGVAGHPMLLMILLEIQHMGVAVAEFEGDAPRAVDMDRIAGGAVAPQRVKVETRQVHILWHGRRIQHIQPPQDARVHPGVNPGRAGFPQGFQVLAGEALYHGDM